MDNKKIYNMVTVKSYVNQPVIMSLVHHGIMSSCHQIIMSSCHHILCMLKAKFSLHIAFVHLWK